MSGGPSKPSKRARELDTSNATKGVWLVKVPNYLDEAWRKALPSADLGVMTINSDPRAVSVTFDLSEELSHQTQSDQPPLPTKHRVVMQSISSQSLSVFSEGTDGGQVVAEGKVSQRADIQPVHTAEYMKLKQHQIKAAGRTKNTATKLESTPVGSTKPVASHSEAKTKASKQLDKRARDDRGKVLNSIFQAFHAHQFYAFRDLVQITKQPPVYLKELLKEVCLYNTKAPHKNTWELKADYKRTSRSSESNCD